MSSIGTGYDYSATTFSPDGRVFQVEYAGKAAENSGTAIGIRCKDGIVFGVEKIILSKLHEPMSNCRNYSIDYNTGLTFSGLQADARALVERAREESRGFRKFYGSDIPTPILAQRLGYFIQYYTLYSFIRPFGCSIMIGNYQEIEQKAHLYMIDPSGVSLGYHACVVGKHSQNAKTELEKLKLDDITVKDAIDAIAKIMYTVHDEVKDKEFKLEMSWICSESNYKHTLIPDEIVDKAVTDAQKALESDNEASDGESD